MGSVAGTGGAARALAGFWLLPGCASGPAQAPSTHARALPPENAKSAGAGRALVRDPSGAAQAWAQVAAQLRHCESGRSLRQARQLAGSITAAQELRPLGAALWSAWQPRSPRRRSSAGYLGHKGARYAPAAARAGGLQPQSQPQRRG